MDNLSEKIRSGGETSCLNNSSKGISTDGDRSWFKVYLLIGITALTALLSGFLLRVGELGYGTLCFVILTTILIIQSLALKYTKEILLASGLCAMGLVLPFLGAPMGYLGGTTLIIFLLLFAAHDRGKREGENMVEIRFSHATRPVVSLILMVGVVMITFLFSVNRASILTEGNVKRTVDLTVTPIAKRYIKDFSSDAKLGDLMGSIALEQINKASGSENLNNFQKQLFVDQSVKEMGVLLKEKTNYNFDNNATVAANIHALVSTKSSGLLDPKAPWGLLVLGVIIFLLVKSIEFALFIPLELLAFMLYELLIAFSFITVQSESKSKEVINLL